MSFPSRLLGALLAVALTLGLAACGGGGAEVKSEITTTTTGQQLVDLKKALDAGAINQQEYERQKKLILDKSR